MSLKDRFANHSDTPAEQPQPEEQKSVELYDTPGHARNICFVQADGSMTFLNYAYLVSGELTLDHEILKLSFTTHLVEITGTNLNEILVRIANQTIKSLFVSIERYQELNRPDESYIKKIFVNKILP